MSVHEMNDQLVPETNPVGEEFERGVQNPNIIDLITYDRGTDEVVLVVMEQRAWGADPQQLAQMDEKLNRYMSYILDGHLVRHYPQYTGKAVRLQLECATKPSDERTQGFLEGVGMICEQNDIRFVARVAGDAA